MKFRFLMFGILVLAMKSFGGEIMLPLETHTKELLSSSEILVDDKNLSFEKVQSSRKFEVLDKKHINLGQNPDLSLWIRFKLNNQSESNLSYVLEIDNPIVDHIFLYQDDLSPEPMVRGNMHRVEGQKTIYPFFTVTVPAQETRIYYLLVKSSLTALQLSLHLLTQEQYLEKDRNKQFMILLFIGVITGFFIYGFTIFLYTKDKSYFFYSLYLLALGYQQLTYVGFLPLYSSLEFIAIDNELSTVKGGITIILAALFSYNFLKVSNTPYIGAIYKSFIGATLIGILFFSTPLFYYPQVILLIGLSFIFYNEFAAIYIYRRGNKQARFFIVGWTFVMLGYIIFIIDILGYLSIMHSIPSLILWATAFEALMLLLAFVDKVSILQNEKIALNVQLNDELQQRHDLIEKKVYLRTHELQQTLNEKMTLYRELHHRVKNNLQIILSIIRLQNDEISDAAFKSSFTQLESRIKAIAKTHEILYQRDDIETIDMYDYILSLCDDIEDSYGDDSLDIKLQIDVCMPFREAVYIGLIINELLSNSFKYAVNDEKVRVTINFEKEAGLFRLYVIDSGKGYNENMLQKKGALGLKLIKTLVENQLKGTMQTNTVNKTEYLIEFRL